MLRGDPSPVLKNSNVAPDLDQKNKDLFWTDAIKRAELNTTTRNELHHFINKAPTLLFKFLMKAEFLNHFSEGVNIEQRMSFKLFLGDLVLNLEGKVSIKNVV